MPFIRHGIAPKQLYPIYGEFFLCEMQLETNDVFPIVAIPMRGFHETGVSRLDYHVFLKGNLSLPLAHSEY